ncbi:MAG: Ig-like domain-containing protein [bacterium]|nr:Ig-like domain-containing protein [bacterium]
MLKYKKITVLFILFLTVIFLFPNLLSAQDIYGTNDLASGGVNLGTRDLTETIARIVNIALGFLGILATLIILYGGFIWMTSGGNADKVDKAKRTIINGVIGLLIILSSYAIARFILKEAGDSIFGPGGSVNPPGYSGGAGLSGGVLESHYPARNATGIARNTNIYVTFSEDMDVSFIVKDKDTCNGTDCPAKAGFIELYKEGDAVAITENNLLVTYDPANLKVFQFNPFGNTTTHLGSDTANTLYRMDLGALQTVAGEAAFPLVGGYSWNFTVSTEIDVTPPRVSSVRPVANSSDNPRNSVIQINFSEAVNPLFAVGEVDGTAPDFSNISVRYPGVAGVNLVEGKYLISNQYKTVEFLTSDLCGQNSCGNDVYCLPSSQNIGVKILPIIEDMASNKLDANANGIGGEDPFDIYEWAFSTNDEIDLTAPNIVAMDQITSASLKDPINVVFSKDLMSSSVNYDSVSLEDNNALINYWLSVLDGKIVRIHHDLFDPLSDYKPTLNSQIKDTLQNCWYICECSADQGETCYCSNNTDGADCPGGNCAVR